MKRITGISFALAAGILICLLNFIPAYALTISTSVNAWDGGLGRNDSNVSTNQPIISTAEATPGFHVMASAAASSDGSLAVAAYPGSWDIFYYNAEASWSDTFTNPSNIQKSYLFNFFISGVTLSIGTSGGHEDDYKDFVSAYAINIFLNNQVIWDSSAEIRGQFNGYDPLTYSYLTSTLFTQTGTNLGGTFVDNTPSFSPSASYTSNPYLGSLDHKQA